MTQCYLPLLSPLAPAPLVAGNFWALHPPKQVTTNSPHLAATQINKTSTHPQHQPSLLFPVDAVSTAVPVLVLTL